jgi:hypothetical protein
MRRRYIRLVNRKDELVIRLQANYRMHLARK